jgi:uncharacterized small protein (DUF1192 family)
LADIWVNILGDGSKLKGELDKSGKNVSSFSEKIGKIGKIATVAGAAITGAFTAIVLKTAKVGDQFDKMSLRTGVAVEDLSALAYAADISGTDIGTLEKGLKGLTKVMDDASMGIGEGMEAFELLNIAVMDSEGKLRSTVDVLKEAATKISAIEDPTKQAALAMDLFGARAGPQLLPLLKMGEEGIEDLMKKAEELGITITTEAATAAAEFTDRMTDLKGGLAGAGRMIGDTLIPAIIPLIEKVTEIVVKIKEWAEENKPLVENIFKWGAALGVALMVLGPIAMILPSLITGVSLLSGAFLPFLITGAIVAGLIKIDKLLDDMNKNVYKAQINLNELSVTEIDQEIESLAQEIKRLEEQIKITSELPLSSSAQFGSLIDTKNAIINLEMKMGILIERRAELTKAEQEGIDVSEEKIKVDKLIAEGQETVNKLLDEWNEKLKIYTKYTDEATESEIKLLDGMYRWTQVASQWKQVSLYFMGVRDSLKAVEKVTDEVTVSQEIMAKATGKVYNKWYELAKLWDVRPDLQEYFKNINRAIEEPLNIDPWKEFFDGIKDRYSDTIGTIQTGILNFVSAAENALGDAFYNILSGAETFGESIKGLFESIVDAALKELARIAAYYVFKWIFGVPTIPIPAPTWGFHSLGGEVKKFQMGGGTDSVLAAVTPGEYIIDKPMTDFIKRFKMIPSNLIEAIGGGSPTPVPAFAGGGPVSTPNIAASGFGETKINVYVTGNNISNELDVRRLAGTIGDEVLRRLEMRRRH